MNTHQNILIILFALLATFSLASGNPCPPESDTEDPPSNGGSEGSAILEPVDLPVIPAPPLPLNDSEPDRETH